MVIWLASFPRSGNSFFRVVSRTIFSREIHSIYSERYAPVDTTGLQQMGYDNELHIIKTHEMPTDSNPAIYLVRDGRDALVSLAWYNLAKHASTDQDTFSSEFEAELKKQILSKAYGGWSNNALAWTQRSEQTVVIRFEDLISNPEETIADAFNLFGINFRRNEKSKLPSFNTLHARNPSLYRKGRIGDWQNHMTESLHNLFWKKHGEAMRAFGYKL